MIILNIDIGIRQLKSSLEAEVDLVIPGDLTGGSKLVGLLQREGRLFWMSSSAFSHSVCYF